MSTDVIKTAPPAQAPSPELTSTEVKPWNDPAKRALVFQILLVLTLGAFAWFIIDNTLNNLEQRGITTGFSFLSQEAGFGIPLSLI
ncbi:amino acid ABC transporter permease, partial [Marinobacterium sp. D7]|nr:amino acid ABC transporter permease [Marinobacterium ramblicola]